VILLETHIWVWWVSNDPRLPGDYSRFIGSERGNGLGISAISCWEVAKLVEHNRLQLSISVDQWISQALQPPVILLPLSPDIAVESTRLPGNFHRDPADQIIVATARRYACALVTLDCRIRSYPHVSIQPGLQNAR